MFEVHSIRLRNKNHKNTREDEACVCGILACRRQHKTDDGDYDENPTIIEDIAFAYMQTATTTLCGTSSTLLHRTTDIVINISA